MKESRGIEGGQPSSPVLAVLGQGLLLRMCIASVLPAVVLSIGEIALRQFGIDCERWVLIIVYWVLILVAAISQDTQ